MGGFQIDKKWPEIYNRKICSDAEEYVKERG